MVQSFDVGGSLFLLKDGRLMAPILMDLGEYHIDPVQYGSSHSSILHLHRGNCPHSEIHAYWKLLGGWYPFEIDGEFKQYIMFQRVVPRVLPTVHWVDETHHAWDERRPTKRNFRVACDFDSVIHQGTSLFTVPSEILDPPWPGVFQGIREILEEGSTFIIHTCRLSHWSTSNPFLFAEDPEKVERALKIWFLLHDMEPNYVDQFHFWRYVGKPSADVYIDDKAFNFDGLFPTIKELREAMDRSEASRASVLGRA